MEHIKNAIYVAGLIFRAFCLVHIEVERTKQHKGQ